jgi:hypothetical protein
MVAGHEGKQLAEVVQVLAGVVQIDDLGGFGEMLTGQVPDRALILASPGDIVWPATPSSPSRGAGPCPQAAQWYQARLRVTGPSTVFTILSR